MKSSTITIIVLILSDTHFSVKLILAINGNLGVFGVADHDSCIRFSKLKMADPIWRLCDSIMLNLYKTRCMGVFGVVDCRFKNNGYKMATILL